MKPSYENPAIMASASLFGASLIVFVLSALPAQPDTQHAPQGYSEASRAAMAEAVGQATPVNLKRVKWADYVKTIPAVMLKPMPARLPPVKAHRSAR